MPSESGPNFHGVTQEGDEGLGPTAMLLSASRTPSVPQGGVGGYGLPQPPPVLLIPAPLGWCLEVTHFIHTAALQVGTISTVLRR